MKAIDSLLHDHERFRLLLDAMDAAIGLRMDTRFVVRELCFTLGERLRDHMRRERELIASCHEPLSAKELAALADGHGDEAQSLYQALAPLTDATAADGLAEARGLLELAIVQFRYHMDAQEYKLFPALAWSLKDDGADRGMQEEADELDLNSALKPLNRLGRWEPVW